eukprot:766917_1
MYLLSLLKTAWSIMSVRAVLQIGVVDAYHLQDNEDSILPELNDPYVIIKVQDSQFKTEVVDDSIHPKWNAQFDMMDFIKQNNGVGTAIVMDKDVITADDFIAKAEFPLPETYDSKWTQHVLELKNEENRPNGVLTVQTRLLSAQQYAVFGGGNTESNQERQEKVDKIIVEHVNSGCQCCTIL